MLTVLMATLNGARTLPVVLERYCSLQSPSGGWKLVVVDNGSTDSTRSVIDAFRNRVPLTYLFEPRPGKNAALNSGLASIEGDLAVFTDDDAVPRTDWLVQLREAADAHPDYGVFGGQVLPRWETPPDRWILEWVPLGPTFSRTEAAAVEGPTEAHNVFGPNMSVRTDLFSRGYRFDVRIGPRGSNYAMGSETALVRRLYGDGVLLWFCPQAIVEHIVPRAHLEVGWILGRAVRFGRGRYRLQAGETSDTFPRLFGAPRYLWRRLITEGARAWAAWCRSDQEGYFRARWNRNVAWGQIVEARAVRAEQTEQR